MNDAFLRFYLLFVQKLMHSNRTKYILPFVMKTPLGTNAVLFSNQTSNKNFQLLQKSNTQTVAVLLCIRKRNDGALCGSEKYLYLS